MKQNNDKKSTFSKLAKFADHLKQLKLVLNRLLKFSQKSICVTNKNHSNKKGHFYQLLLDKHTIELTEYFESHTDITTLNVHNGEFMKNDECIAAKHIVPFNTKIQDVIANLMDSKAVLYRN